MTKILLVRHGHVEGIQPERFLGRRDMPLSQVGLLEAHAAARYLSSYWHPVIVYTSPLQRCVQTGQEIANLCGVAAGPLELVDLDYGLWQWQTHEDVKTRNPE